MKINEKKVKKIMKNPQGALHHFIAREIDREKIS